MIVTLKDEDWENAKGIWHTDFLNYQEGDTIWINWNNRTWRLEKKAASESSLKTAMGTE